MVVIYIIQHHARQFGEFFAGIFVDEKNLLIKSNVVFESHCKTSSVG